MVGSLVGWYAHAQAKDRETSGSWFQTFAVLWMLYFFLLGDFPASEFYMPTFRNTLFHLYRRRRWNCVPKRRHIKFRCREITQKKNTTVQQTSGCQCVNLTKICIVVSQRGTNIYEQKVTLKRRRLSHWTFSRPSSLPCSHELQAGFRHQQEHITSKMSRIILFIKIHFNIIIPSSPGSPKQFLSLSSRAKNLCAFLTLPPFHISPHPWHHLQSTKHESLPHYTVFFILHLSDSVRQNFNWLQRT